MKVKDEMQTPCRPISELSFLVRSPLRNSQTNYYRGLSCFLLGECPVGKVPKARRASLATWLCSWKAFCELSEIYSGTEEPRSFLKEQGLSWNRLQPRMNIVELSQTNGRTAQHVCLPWAQIPPPAPTGLHPSLSNWAMRAKASSRLEKMAVTQF